MNSMMYPYLTLNDDTEIVHSELYMEKHQWLYRKRNGVFKKLVRNNSHVILEFAQEGVYKDISESRLLQRL